MISRYLLFLLIEGQGWNQCIQRLQRRSDFSPENRIAPLSNRAAEGLKDSSFLISSHTFRSKVHPKGPKLAHEEIKIPRCLNGQSA